MPICPAGHQTAQTDFCDTCGLPVPGGQTGIPAAPPPISAAVPPPVICPHCQTPNVADALFCEACGYDFTTGTLPAPAIDPVPVVAPVPAPAPVPDADAATPPGAPEAEPSAEPDNATADVAAGEPGTPEVAVAEDPRPEPVAEAAPAGGDAETPSTPVPAPAEGPSAPVAAPAYAPSTPVPEPVPARPRVEWVAELWIDPDWYAAQGSSDPLPSPGLPDIVPLVKEGNLIGRVSHSRGIFPDVDCELDTGCSRRHAMLSTDGTRWWIEDLNSANGTFVGSPAGPLPAMPIPQGRVELTPGQRLYVGAWTRIVVRRATPDEQEALA
ncbi:MAG: FHA domain-containing protein [Actinobacteria bacterium]|nr:FHA domain-containing protein [Actinomycetota bacterium]